MSQGTSTGSFWRCPSCEKHVPSRQETCRCGFERGRAPKLARQVRVGSAAAQVSKAERSGPRLGAVVRALSVILLLGGASYWAYLSWKAPAPAPEDSELARKIREGREARARRPAEVVVIPAPTVLVSPSSAPDLTPPEVFDKVKDAVVVILSSGAQSAQGSGVVISDSRVVTNRHVVEGATQIAVRTANRSISASIVAIDRNHDLAILATQIQVKSPLTVRTSGELRVGERVYAVGAPQGFVSEGLVSGLRPYEGGAAIQTTAPVSPGSSGGGLFDAKGHLIGITTFGWRGGENLNFALPAEWAAALNNQNVNGAVITTASKPRTEEEIQRDRAEAIYRPRMERVAAIVGNLRVLSRRYYDACYRRKTVTTTEGERSGGADSGGVAWTHGRAIQWSGSESWNEQWGQVSSLDNSTTPQCRLIASEILDLAPKVQAIMAEADREVVKAGVWTWLQRDVPEKLAAELWPDRL